jgi:hypothetical protein
MSHAAYELALLRRDQLLQEAADRRLAAGSASPLERAESGTPRRFLWLFRASRASSSHRVYGHAHSRQSSGGVR